METANGPSVASIGNKRKPRVRNARKYNVKDICNSAYKEAEGGGLPSSGDLNRRGDEAVLLSDVDETKHASLAINDKENALSESLASLSIRAPARNLKKKLLILDLNGVLIDMKFRRPFCLGFLKFCFERFEVGIWSSRTKKNIDKVIDYLMGDLKHKLLFCWDASHCTVTRFKTLENKHKPLVFKDLRRIWEKHDPELPWEKGFYNESNTLLVDDSPYKALLNPVNTAIFPYSYQGQDLKDNALGDGGDLRVYLEGLLEADNVQKFVEQNPFGQKPITERSPTWGFYLKVMNTMYPY
ncbi:hypothetical protein JCGZ_19960 [Jatropha curcas]|uniref:Mitochondrial import inner membrane translocase subunit TIM50 n=1 Tax=Jatropha curcas TaxID=180498 RepID=A0A067JTI9_JATCU|nr:uncharacterized protein LOC105644171 [Jatropha curcas]KDP27261.1 hypothetical protein JCGZ_19960 [Jatropha curcas]